MAIEKVVRKVTRRDQDREDREFWQSQTPEARLAAQARMIIDYYGLSDEPTPREKRIPTVTKRPYRQRSENS